MTFHSNRDESNREATIAEAVRRGDVATVLAELRSSQMAHYSRGFNEGAEHGTAQAQS